MAKFRGKWPKMLKRATAVKNKGLTPDTNNNNLINKSPFKVDRAIVDEAFHMVPYMALKGSSICLKSYWNILIQSLDFSNIAASLHHA
ncbi:hypothetical protein CEXT_633301 [Caerostris extrusa]|uniref:Uncharacterized protein n=1 Tax=Caerostris extrusa TaxID=172846 RepID=A0AAV4N091_CAEEX|nr:hypothetical protein CEXT_633301 [Caerostris extrusa]